MSAAGPDVAVAFAAATLITLGGTSPKILRGYTLRETAGAAAVVRLRDTDATGTILVTIRLLPDESRDDTFENGRTSAGGVFMQLVSGAVEGSVFV